MISLPAGATDRPGPAGAAARTGELRKESGPALRGQRVRVGPRETGCCRRSPLWPGAAAGSGRLPQRDPGRVTSPRAAHRPAGVTRPDGQNDPDGQNATGVPAFLHALLRQVEPFPAAVLNARWDILAFNRGYDALFSLESVPVRSRNAVLLYFTDPGLRELWPDWADDAPRVVSQFRAAMARHGSEPAWAALLDRLRRASADFDRLWEQDDAGVWALCRNGSCTRWPAVAAGPFPPVGRAGGRGSRRRRLHARRRGDRGQAYPPAGAVHRCRPGPMNRRCYWARTARLRARHPGGPRAPRVPCPGYRCRVFSRPIRGLGAAGR